MEKTAVLLVNLGTPDAPDTKSVRKYLKIFLSDKRVIDLPRWRWLPILHGIVLRFRPKKSAKLYKSIWTKDGSPLLVYSQKQQQLLANRFEGNGNVKVTLAMNYGAPSITTELEKLHHWGVRHLIVLPLFPQYSSTTTASVWDHVQKVISKWRDIPELSFIRDFPDHPQFIELLQKRVDESIEVNGTPDAIVASYHGIPNRYAESGDDYVNRCTRTTDALRRRFPSVPILQCFQSKFGKEPWVEPATSDKLIELAKTDKKHVQIIAPAFTADCLETLEELEVENRDIFLSSGGKAYHYLPAANDDSLFIDCLESLIVERLKDSL
ncbi:ferrochelatase [Evansella cellulosilytica]|uniref:Coproporphyrin III ferrochelatase n=1 Tax=Evansella cellulosilytica (strain ATCC 21833 / DSM 2522 / FERM P-1141 / JCM 9156 / N-4) TaxID=649639 RepID=E6TT69_EVAC2|nr:ferrochelatase [Evansella cellulosilytica]ADU31977.1 ferrochelatase [Evansella cellulosilytica DSM 2522]